MNKPLRMGMVGGGPGSLIGPIHRMAAELDGHIRLVAGASSRDAQKSRAAGAGYDIDTHRSYGDYHSMFAAERTRTDGIELVAILTPNHVHLPVALAALEAGLHVISDKPATATLAEALTLHEAVRASKQLYALMGVVWHTQVAVLLVGHIVSICLAHAMARRTFPAQRQVNLSQLPLLVLMVLYTTSGLWILSLPLGSE